VADDHLHALGGELVRNRHALLRIRDVVADHNLQLLAVDAARRVDVLDRLLDAVLELRAESGVRARDGAGHADLDLRVGHGRERQAKTERNAGQQQFLHEVTPLGGFYGLSDARFGGASRRPRAIMPLFRPMSRRIS
jgi:hypothetical protein